MAHCEGILLEKTLLIFLGFFVLFLPLCCWCLNLTHLDLRGMHASQISEYKGLSAELAIDGDSKTQLKCSHTEKALRPWWKVDLGTNHRLGRITLVNRNDTWSKRLNGANVRAGTESDIFNNAACGLPMTWDQASIPGAHIRFVCDPPLVARYVSVDIQRNIQEFLTLCEVMVEEYLVEDRPQTTPIVMSTSAMIVGPSFACMSTLMFKGKCVADQRPLLDVNMKSLLGCFLGCKMNSDCWSFDYVTTFAQCRLHDVKAADLKVVDQPGCLVYEVARG